MSALRRVSAMALVGVGAVLLASAGLGGPSADAAVVCSDADVNLAAGITLGCSIAGAPVQPNDPPAGTRTYSVAIDLTTPGVSAEAVVANDSIFQAVSADTSTPQDTVDEVVSSMVGRTGATVGVNGGYFDIFQGGQTPYTGSVCGAIVVAGEVWKSPPVGTDSAATAQLDTALYVDGDGAMRIDHVGFAGTVTVRDGDSSVSQPLASVNDITTALPVPRCPSAYLPGPSTGEGIALLTPRLGAAQLNPGPGEAPGFTVPATRQVTLVAATPVPGSDDLYTVNAVTLSQGLSTIAPVPDGQVVLLGSGSNLTTPGGWLSTLQSGQTVSIDQTLTIDGEPASGIQALVGGVAQIVEGGVAVTDPVGYVPPSGEGESKHAETVIGVDGTGQQVTVLAIDRSDGSPGVWWQEAAQLISGSGVQDAILFDGGGSTTLAAVMPDQDGTVTVVNTPEGDNVLSEPSGQRYVGSGLVFSGSASPAVPVNSSTPVPASSPKPILPATGAGTATPGLAVTGALLVAAGVLLARRRPDRRTR